MELVVSAETVELGGHEHDPRRFDRCLRTLADRCSDTLQALKLMNVQFTFEDGFQSLVRFSRLRSLLLGMSVPFEAFDLWPVNFEDKAALLFPELQSVSLVLPLSLPATDLMSYLPPRPVHGAPALLGVRRLACV